MAEFRFRGTPNDAFSLLQSLIALRRFKFVIDMSYDEPVPLTFIDLTPEITDIIVTWRHLYLFSDEYSCYPPVFFGLFKRDDGINRYHLDPADGGPMLHLSLGTRLCIPREEEGPATRQKVHLSPTELWYQPYYVSPEGEAFRPPESMKKAFQDVKKLMLRQTVKRYARLEYEEPGTGNRVSRIEPFYFGLDGNRLLESDEAVFFAGIPVVSGHELRKKRQDFDS